MNISNRATSCLLALQLACEEDSESAQPPTGDEIEALVERRCVIRYTCYDVGTDEEAVALIEECKSENNLYIRLTEKGNPECSDLWLVYTFHDCRASLGCRDYIETTPEDPGSPCHEELMAVYDANCRY